MSYLGWKLIHIASVVIFLGNITTGLFWAAHANQSGNFSQIASTFQAIIKSDRWFTVPGVVGILISGFAMAVNGKIPILGTGWIFWPLALFAISGLVFSVWLAPLQTSLLEFVQQSEKTASSWTEYRKLYLKWEIWGLVALITPIAAFVIMILKPDLPGLK
jgi:uncharacterized membrane protein